MIYVEGELAYGQYDDGLMASRTHRDMAIKVSMAEILRPVDGNIIGLKSQR